MKFVMVSNYLNHHQIPFCNAMYRLLEGKFAFIQTEQVEEERIRMGWKEKNEQPYLKCYYEEPELCRRWIEEAEVVMLGGTDEESYIQGQAESRETCDSLQRKTVQNRAVESSFAQRLKKEVSGPYQISEGAGLPVMRRGLCTVGFSYCQGIPRKDVKMGIFSRNQTV